MVLHRLWCHMGSALHRDANQRIHPRPFVRIRPVSTRDIGSRGQHERPTLRLLRLRTDVDSEARARDVAGRVGIGDGGDYDRVLDSDRSDGGHPPLHRLRRVICGDPGHHPHRHPRLLARHRRDQFRRHPDRTRPRWHDLPVHGLRRHMEFYRRGRRHRHPDHRVLLRGLPHPCVEIHRDVRGGREIPDGCG